MRGLLATFTDTHARPPTRREATSRDSHGRTGDFVAGSAGVCRLPSMPDTVASTGCPDACVRREALLIRVEVKDLRRRFVAAEWWELRAA